MVALPTQYNVSDLPDTGAGAVLIPQGQYQALIVKSEMVNSKKGGQFIALTILVNQGQFAGTEFIERLNIVNNNAVAVEIAYKTLARISESLNMDKTPADSTELHNKPLMIEVKTEAGKPYTDNSGNQKTGSDKSIISKYLKIPAGGVQTTPVVQQEAQQQEAQQQATATPPAANPFAQG